MFMRYSVFLLNRLTLYDSDRLLRLTSARAQEPDLTAEAHSFFQPRLGSLKTRRWHCLKLFPVPLPPGQTPACAPFDRGRHRLARRSTIRWDPLASIPLSSKSAPYCLWEWSG